MKQYLILLLLLFSPFLNAATIKVTIDVKGMTCSLCVTSINQALRKTEGVIKAKASLKTEQAEVLVAENFELNNLLQAVEKTGYSGSISHVEKLSDTLE